MSRCPATADRPYYLFVKANYTSGYQGETDLTNNVSAAIPITLNAPDLVVSAASAPATGTVNASITVNWTVTNQGDVAAPAQWYDSVYISSSNTFDGTALAAEDRYNGIVHRPPAARPVWRRTITTTPA